MTYTPSNQSQRIEGWERDEDNFSKPRPNIFDIYCTKKFNTKNSNKHTKNNQKIDHQQQMAKRQKINIKLPSRNKIIINRAVSGRVKTYSMRKQMQNKQSKEGAKSSRPKESVDQYLKNNTEFVRYNDHAKERDNCQKQFRKKRVINKGTIKQCKNISQYNKQNIKQKQPKQPNKQQDKNLFILNNYQKYKQKYFWKTLFSIKKQELVFNSCKLLKKKNEKVQKKKTTEVEDRCRNISHIKQIKYPIESQINQKQQQLTQKNQIKIMQHENPLNKLITKQQKNNKIYKKQMNGLKRKVRQKYQKIDRLNQFYKQADLFTDAHLIQISENISNFQQFFY